MKIQLRLPITTLTFICFVLLPNTQAVSPPPDGGYSGGNTAEGQSALLSLTTGTYNTALGLFSLRTLTDGQFNTAVGAGTLLFNTSDQNTAVGAGALLSNTGGNNNTAAGAFALFFNAKGVANSAFGWGALESNTYGGDNTAIGTAALQSNTAGNNNTAVGYTALENNIVGFFNTATGNGALENNTAGNYNTALGVNAGRYVTTANNVIAIGTDGANVSNTTWIGNVYGIATQSGQTAPVIVSVDGQLGTVVSSERFKKDIAAMEKASEAILSLRPVTFHYKTDTEGTSQFGLIAEEVAKVNPGLVLTDKEGKPYTVRYDAVNAMLLNEFLKEHKTVQEQGATIARLQEQIDALTATLQKMSVQLGANKSEPQLAASNR